MEEKLRRASSQEHGGGDGGESNAVGIKPRPSARQTFEDCPLIEIVHFHECLRGELRSLKTNVETLCRKVRNRHRDASSAAAARTPPPSKLQEDPAASAPMVLELEEKHGGGDPKTTAAATTATVDATGSFQWEDLKLEVQVQSQFRLLWAVFQSHSTAEDEVIWPALKEKARSSGGKLKLVNHEADSSAPPPPQPPPAAAAATTTTTTAAALGAAGGRSNGGAGGPNEAPRRRKAEQGAQPLRASRSDCDLAAAADLEAGRAGEGVVDDAAGGEEEKGQVGEAMIDEAEYTEDHDKERRLFEGMQEMLTGLRNTRNSSVPERLKVVAGLGKKTDEMCRHLMTHLDKEEESALPLIKHYFTGPEMGALVGKIMGKRPTELMQTILAMMIKNLPAEEVHTVMGYMRHAVKDTYFEKWLASGGFQWPTNTNAPSDKAGEVATEQSAYLDYCKGVWAGAVKPGGYGCDKQGATSARTSHRCHLSRPVVSNIPILAAAVAATPECVSGTVTATPSGLRLPNDRNGKRRGGGGGGRAGVPLGAVGGEAAGVGAAGAAGKGQPHRRGDGYCHLDREFEGMALKSGGATRGPGSAGGDGGADTFGRLSSEQAEADNRCSVCSYIGRCPVNEPLSQAEFELAVKRLSHAGGLSTERKSTLVQMMRNHMYQGRKRPRPGSIPAAPPDGTASPSSLSPYSSLFPVGGPRQPTARTAGVALAAPARYYTSTQPDIEDANGGSGGDGSPPALFTPEELAPTYHVAPGGGGAVGGGARQDAQPGDGDGGERAVLGCPHYRRACKIRAPCCQKLFTCRLCHDHASDHTMDRGEVTEMLCMRCGTLQPVHSECRNPNCRVTAAENLPPETGRKMSRYYCGICHLFDDAPDKDIYHCPYCNMCRLGKGLGVDFFHCMTCNACISSKTPTHACFRKGMESDCPICNTSLFTSTSQVKGLRCGHFMHLACYKEYIRRAESREFWYRCPVCRKSMEDMTEYFSQMDSMVASQPMPVEYSGWKVKVLCHDCERYSEVPYHFYYLKCGACGSYNTRVEGTTLREGATGLTAPLPPPRAPGPPSGSSGLEDGHSAPPGP